MKSAHDHRRCIADALDAAERVCAGRGAQLTELRRRVLELVWQSHQPVGAYQLLAALGRDGHNPAPPTIYRALDFLQAQGLVHRIESHNAFVGCPHAETDHAGQLMICHECGTVTELLEPAIGETVRRAAQAAGFRPERVTLELEGTCGRCAAGTRPTGGRA
jgi:Fur family zinc uptake transcriptional regulator